MLLLIAGALFAVTILAVAAFGAGFWIPDLLPPSFSAIERLAFTLLGGLGILSLVLFLIGQLAFTRATILGTVALFVFLSIRPIRRLLLVQPTVWKMQVGALPAIVIVLVLLTTSVAGLAEITGHTGNDAIAYHLLGPKVWLEDGLIRPLPEVSTTAFPATSEVLFGALYALGGQRAPSFSALLTLACFFVVAYSLARAAGLDERGSWWAVAFTASMPAVYIGAHSGFIDVLYAAFILAAARVGFEAEGQSGFILFGLFCGLSIATKYTGLTAVPVLVCCAALSQYFGRHIQKVSVLKYAVLAILIGAVIASPYYLRNWILLGCPIYPPPPFLANLVPVKFFSPESLHKFYATLYARGSGLGRGLVAYFLLPYNLTYHTSNFNGAGWDGLDWPCLWPTWSIRGSFPSLCKGARTVCNFPHYFLVFDSTGIAVPDSSVSSCGSFCRVRVEICRIREDELYACALRNGDCLLSALRFVHDRIEPVESSLERLLTFLCRETARRNNSVSQEFRVSECGFDSEPGAGLRPASPCLLSGQALL